MTDYKEHFVPVPDGLRIFARDYKADGNGNRLPIVCVPGFTRNTAEFDDVARRMVAHGRRVLAIDNRGRGRSSWDPQPERYVYESYASDAIAVLDALGIPKAIFLGQSMGGRVALFAHRAAPDRIGGMIFNDTGPTPTTSGLDRVEDYLKYLTKRFGSWEELAAELAETNANVYPGRGPDFFLKLAHQVAREYPDGIGCEVDPNIGVNFNQLLRPKGVPVDFTGMIKDLASIPLLLVHGMLSDLVTAAGIADLMRFNLDLTVVDVPNVGHCPTLDEPEAWNGIVAFLDRVP